MGIHLYIDVSIGHLYNRLTSTGIILVPLLSGCIALPITAPKAFRGSFAFMACPLVEDVVNKSPISTGDRVASTLQYTLPVKATVNLGLLFVVLLRCSSSVLSSSESSTNPGLYLSAPDTIPATLLSYEMLLGSRSPLLLSTMTVPGSL